MRANLGRMLKNGDVKMNLDILSDLLEKIQISNYDDVLNRNINTEGTDETVTQMSLDVSRKTF